MNPASWKTKNQGNLKEREGHCRVSSNHLESHYRLGSWVSHQRVSKDKLSDDRIRRLDELGFVWDALTEKWEEGFSALSKYKEREDHCRVPGNHLESHYRLGQWVSKQRSSADKLTEDRRMRLDELDFVWEALEDHWEEGFSALLKYKEREGHCRVSTNHLEDGYRLGLWVAYQRQKEQILSPCRKLRLEKLQGWSWNLFVTKWDYGYKQLKVFSEKENHSIVPYNFRTAEGFNLGGWVVKQRSDFDSMSLERKTKLESLPGWSWHVLSDQWEKGFAGIKEYADQTGHCRVPISYKTDDGYKLGTWVSTQRLKIDSIPDERVHRLVSLPGWSWDPHSERWEEGFSHLTAFVASEGHSQVYARFKAQNGYQLGNWVSTQRLAKEKLSIERQSRLEMLQGWSWDPITDLWNKRFLQLCDLASQRQSSIIPSSLQLSDGTSIGTWVSLQRSKRADLTEEQTKQLESLPSWSWDIQADRWNTGFEQLEDFLKSNGHLNVPAKYISENGFKLGQWVGIQRGNADRMPTVRKQLLESLLGWVWNAKDASWEEGLRHLKTYIQMFGNANVKQGFIDDEGFRLGRWVSYLRKLGAKGISQHRREQLEAIPEWIWQPLLMGEYWHGT